MYDLCWTSNVRECTMVVEWTRAGGPGHDMCMEYSAMQVRTMEKGMEVPVARSALSEGGGINRSVLKR